MKHKFKFKKVLLFSSLFSTLIAVSAVSSACAAPAQQINSDKKVNVIPASTPYETIHNLAFSLQFANTGGQQNPGAPSTQIQSSPYSIFGTGWLFDWKLNSDIPDSAGNVDWTGYFATNLHVANGLLNPSDNEDYIPSWLKTGDKKGYDYTYNFSLGKFDNDSSSPLNSINHNTNLTFVTLGTNNLVSNSLPKTQFASTNFTNSNVSVNTKPGMLAVKYPAYIDFAVLAINIKYMPAVTLPQQVAINNVYKYWIKPAMSTLKTLYPKNATNPDLTYQDLFDSTSYVSELKPDPGNIYIGGYPFYNSAANPYYPFAAPPVSGSPVWTINVDQNASVSDGQPIDTMDESGASGPLTPNGIFNSNAQSNFMLNYHGVDYKMYGIGYIVNDSNLAGGSSGSMALTKDNKLLGIYFGTLADSAGNESSVGLLEGLVVPKVPAELSNIYKISPYDLIGWSSASTTITNQNKSYFSSLKLPTYLFSNIPVVAPQSSPVFNWIPTHQPSPPIHWMQTSS